MNPLPFCDDQLIRVRIWQIIDLLHKQQSYKTITPADREAIVSIGLNGACNLTTLMRGAQITAAQRFSYAEQLWQRLDQPKQEMLLQRWSNPAELTLPPAKGQPAAKPAPAPVQNAPTSTPEPERHEFNMFKQSIENALEALRKSDERLTDNLTNARDDWTHELGELEKQIDNLASSSVETASQLNKRLDELCRAVETRPEVKRKLAVTAARQSEPLLEGLSGLYEPGVSHGSIVALIMSAPGLGKSYLIRKLAEAYDVFIEHGCSNDSEEVNTLKGGAAVGEDGKFVIYDGAITQAMRSAAAGKTTLLFLDEVLRLSDKAQNMLLTWLTGVKLPDGTEVFRWRTRKPDSSGVLEVIEAPITHLHVIAAGNLNKRPEDAFYNRFYAQRIPFDKSLVQRACLSIARATLDYPEADLERYARQFAEVVEASRALYAQGQLAFSLSVRNFERACIHAARCGADQARFSQLLTANFSSACSLWDARTSETDTSSLAACQKLDNLFNSGLAPF